MSSRTGPRWVKVSYNALRQLFLFTWNARHQLPRQAVPAALRHPLTRRLPGCWPFLLYNQGCWSEVIKDEPFTPGQVLDP